MNKKVDALAALINSTWVKISDVEEEEKKSEKESQFWWKFGKAGIKGLSTSASFVVSIWMKEDIKTIAAITTLTFVTISAATDTKIRFSVSNVMYQKKLLKSSSGEFVEVEGKEGKRVKEFLNRKRTDLT